MYFGEHTEHDSSEQLLTDSELILSERRFDGGGVVGRLGLEEELCTLRGGGDFGLGRGDLGRTTDLDDLLLLTGEGGLIGGGDLGRGGGVSGFCRGVRERDRDLPRLRLRVRLRLRERLRLRLRLLPPPYNSLNPL